MARPGKYNIAGYRGDSFSLELTFKDRAGNPVALPTTAWSAQMRGTASSETVVAEFAVDASDAGTGLVRISLTPDQTAALSSGVWDIQLNDDGRIRTYLRGSALFGEDVTR